MKTSARGPAAAALLAIFMGAGAALAQPAPAPGETPVNEQPAPPPTGEVSAEAPALSDPEAPLPPPGTQATLSAPKALSAMPSRVDAKNEAEEPDSAAARQRPLTHHFGIHLGARVVHIPSSGYDPFSDSNGLGQSVIAATFTPWRSLPFSAHVAAEWNVGSSNALARGDETSLSLYRFAAGIEGRYEPISRLYLFVKLMPAALHARAEIEDPALNVTLKSRSWAWSLDATGGAAFRVASGGKDHDPAVSFWLLCDMGYSFAGKADMVFTPGDVEEESRRFGSVALPGLDPSGFVTRITGALTF